MPSINQVIFNISAVQNQTPTAPFLITGKPGEGKSDCCYQIAANQNIPPHRVLRVHLGNYDRVDLGGVPEIAVHEPTGERITVFRPSGVFADFGVGSGHGMIILEETTSMSDKDMEQFVAQFILERETSNFKLDPKVRIIATGNRAEDRSGAKPLLAHLNDRFYHQDMETSLDDWCEWAMAHGGIPHTGIAFLRLRPGLLNDFDPNRRSNPTQRSWTKLFTEVPTNIPTDSYLSIAEGKVGEGAAAEWVAARDMMGKMPSIDTVRLQPAKAEVPAEPAVCYALATAMSMTATANSFARDMEYMTRMKTEFQMVYVTDTLRLNPDLQQTKDFITWAVANKDIFLG